MVGRSIRVAGNVLGKLVVIFGAAWGVSCTPDPIVTPARNLERPADMAFACLEQTKRADNTVVLSGRPMKFCNDPAPADLATARFSHPTNNTQTQTRLFGTFGFLTNTARGEVAVVDLDPGKDTLVDLDIASPGFNQVPVGSFPEAITVSDDGCRAVTANRGSCDLSLLDVSSVMSEYFAIPAVTAGTRPAAGQLRILTGSGTTFLAQPREVTFLPSPTSAADAPLCDAARAGEVLVTFPNCSLVAVVDVSSGAIRSSVKVMPDGSAVDAGNNPSCPNECLVTVPEGRPIVEPPRNPEAGAPLPVDAAALPDAIDAADDDGGVADAGVVDGGVVEAAPPLPLPTPGPSGRIAGLALMPDGTRAFVGMVESPYVLALDLRADNAPDVRRLVPLGSAGRIPLAENPGGVTRLRLSVDPFAAEKGGRFVGGRGKFLYVFARDGSVRVLNIPPRDNGVVEECDVNVDPTEFGTATARDGCIRLSTRPVRQLLARGPGMRVPATLLTDVEPPLPIDIAFAEIGRVATGFLLTSSGQVLHVGLGVALGLVDEDMNATPTHWFLPAAAGDNAGRGGGPPVADGTPARNFSATDVPYATKVAPELTEGPRLAPFGSSVQSSTNVYASFPNNVLVPPQGVRIEWQGVLPNASRRSGRLAPASPAAVVADNVGALNDIGANFCHAGVEPGDIVSLLGCTLDANCEPLNDEICYRSVPGGPGVCVPRSMAADETRMRTCRVEFASRRRYEVKEATRGGLRLGLKWDEVDRPGLAACQLGPGDAASEDPVCQPDASHKPDTRVTGDRGFSCQPIGGRGRCVKPCGARLESGAFMLDPATGRPALRDELCRAGHVCADVGDASVGPICVEAPAPKAECLTGEIRYAVRAGRAFRVTSESLPQFVSQTDEPAGGRCVPVPSRDYRLVDRIRLDGMLCDGSPTAGTAAALGEFIRRTRPTKSNPCFFRGASSDEPGTPAAAVLPLQALFENPYMSFVLTDIEDYVGDAAVISFQVLGGFVTTNVASIRPESDVALGTRIITGPIAAAANVAGSNLKVGTDIPVPPYLFVIDQGRTLRELSRGQLLRLNPRPWAGLDYQGGFYDSSATETRWPIQ